MFVSVALAMIHDMDVGNTTGARLTAPAWERPGGLLGVGKGREWEQWIFGLLGWTASMAIVVVSILGDTWVSSSEWGGVA